MPTPLPAMTEGKPLLTVREAASLLRVSESWVRRHLADLPMARVGRLVRFDSSLLSQQVQVKLFSGKSLKPERKHMLSRYQRGSVYLSGKKVKMWYGVFRQDMKGVDGQVERRQKKVRLGTLAQLPTKNSARDKLQDLLTDSEPGVAMNFQELAERWQNAEGPTMKVSTLRHYQNALRAYVIPVFGNRMISEINREQVQNFLAEQSSRYSKSSLHSMRLVLGFTLGWAHENGWLQVNPCRRIRLPRNAGGRRVIRTVLTAGQVNAIAERLEEPYATLVLFLAASGLRIGEAIAVKWSDFAGNVMHVSRRIYDGEEGSLKSENSIRGLPIDPSLLLRMQALEKGEWIFCSRKGTPVNPGNALKRHVSPAAQEIGIALGGWHDFRHTLTTTMRRNGVHPKVVSGILGHSKVALAMDVYDHADTEDFRQPLATVAEELLPSVTKNAATA
jgi:excisionase family DNA binding protein